MRFQMSRELQEISDVTKVAWKRVPNSRGNKMKWAFTGWLEVNPGILSIVSKDERRTCDLTPVDNQNIISQQNNF